MYWQNRFERENPDEKLEKEILDIRKVHKDYGYRRIWGELRNRNIFVNKKKVQRLVQKLNLQVTSFTHKSRKYSSYKGKVGKIAPNRINRRFNTSVPHQKITTDRGWAYQMKAYSQKLKENRIFQSMSRKGNCHDNSVMENFFGILKQEIYYGKVYYSYEELKQAIIKYIDYYNNKRIKQKLGWLSPVEYRINALVA